MAGEVYRKLRKNNEPLAMIIGAAHTGDITAYFDKKKISYYVLGPSGLNRTNVWSDLSEAEYERKEEGKSVFVNKQIGGFFESIRNFRPRIQARTFPNVSSSFMLIARMTILHQAGLPVGSIDPAVFESNGVHVVTDTLDISNPDDITFELKKNNGEPLYVRAVRDTADVRFESAEKAFQEIIGRLERINARNLSPEQRIKAYEEIMAAFKVGNFAVYISPVQGTLRQF